MVRTPEAAEFVDRQVAHLAHKIGPAATERLIDEAIAQFMPETAEELRRQAADGRHFTIDHRQLSFTGTSRVYGELDLAERIHVTSYEVPDRLAEQVDLRDATCVFPWCTRPARRGSVFDENSTAASFGSR